MSTVAPPRACGRRAWAASVERSIVSGSSEVALAAYNGTLKGEVPCWAVRPGALGTIRPAAEAMSLWLAIFSVNGKEMRACIASEGTLGQTIAVTRNTVRRKLGRLRKVPGLLFELDRGKDRKTGRIRPFARWATDPTSIDTFKSILAGWRIRSIAKEAGLGSGWYATAMGALERHCEAAVELGRRMRSELPSPCSEPAQYAGGGGGGEKRRERRQRTKKKRKAIRKTRALTSEERIGPTGDKGPGGGLCSAFELTATSCVGRARVSRRNEGGVK